MTLAARPRLRGLPRPAVALGVLVLVLANAPADTLFEKQQQLHGVNGRIVDTKTRLKSLQDQELTLKRQIAVLDDQLARIAESIAQEQAKLERLRQQVEAAKAELAAKEEALAQHVANFSRRMRFLYKSGRVSGLELVFSAFNFADLMNRIFFFNDIVREDRRELEQLRLERKAIQTLKADLEAKHTQQTALVKRIKDQQAQLAGVRADRLAKEQELQSLQGLLQRELDEMEAQRAALQAEIARLIQESLRARSSGRWIWPVDGVITQGFGCSPYFFEPYDPNCASHHFHSGIDIANDYGTRIHAADGGIVHNFATSCSWNPDQLCGYGRYVILVHGGGFISLYGHLSGWAIADGSQVAKDTVVGYLGSSGASTGPHLHFEIDLGGTPVNPLSYLP